MWPFDKRPKISHQDFVTREASKVFEPEYVEGLAQTFAKAGYPDVSKGELAAFLFFITQAALWLSDLSEEVPDALEHTVCLVAEKRFGPTFKSAYLAYMGTLKMDLDRGSEGRFMPDTMELALSRMVGRDDEKVVALRLALLTATTKLLRNEMEFLKGIRVGRATR